MPNLYIPAPNLNNQTKPEANIPTSPLPREPRAVGSGSAVLSIPVASQPTPSPAPPAPTPTPQNETFTGAPNIQPTNTNTSVPANRGVLPPAIPEGATMRPGGGWQLVSPPGDSPPDAPPPIPQPVFDAARWSEISQAHAAAGSQAHPNEYYAIGGRPEDWTANYGATSWWTPEGQHTTQHPDYGLDVAGFETSQKQHEAAGTQMPPWEWEAFGGKPERYAQLYKQGAWYNADGTKTVRHPEYASGRANETTTLFPDYTPAKAPEIGNVPAPTFSPVNYEGASMPGHYEAPRMDARDYIGDWQTSPMYEWQMEQGMQALDRMLSARGHLNSNVEFEQKQDLIARLNAQEAERARENAENTAQRTFDWETNNANNQWEWQTQEAERHFDAAIRDAELRNDFNMAEALRQQQAEFQKATINAQVNMANAEMQNGNVQGAAQRLLQIKQLMLDSAFLADREQWGRITDMLSFMLMQNPMQYAYGGSGGLAGITTEEGNALWDFYALLAGGGAGAGGGGGGATLPPLPDSPDYSNINPLQIISDGASDVGYGSLVGQFFQDLVANYGK